MWGVRTTTAPEGTTQVQSDESWFNDLFARHATDVFRYFKRRALTDDVDDLTADVFATAWRRRADVPADAELPWLYRTAGFVLANHRRKGRPVPVADLPEQVDPSDSERSVVDSDEINRVLADLSPRDRQLLLLAAWEGLKGAELAAALGLTRQAADAALYRARNHLTKLWDSRPDAEG